jgi:hypothetical protein
MYILFSCWDLVDAWNIRTQIYTHFRPNQEQLRKMQLQALLAAL